ncbi:hypothetical protein OAV30_00475 [Candidatus Pelagibacter sp.]|nr:hypothetical protein [Candidatus Pelagibacter sp.]
MAIPIIGAVVGVALRGFGKALARRSAKKAVSKTIDSVKPNVPKTKLEKAKSKLAIAKQKTKGSKAKLDQTVFEISQKAKGK